MRPGQGRQTSPFEDGLMESSMTSNDDKQPGSMTSSTNAPTVADLSKGDGVVAASSIDGKLVTMNGPLRPENGASSSGSNQATGSSRIVSSVAASASINNETVNAQTQNVVQNSAPPVRVAATMQRHPPQQPSAISQPQAQPRISDQAATTNASGRM